MVQHPQYLLQIHPRPSFPFLSAGALSATGPVLFRFPAFLPLSFFLVETDFQIHTLRSVICSASA